MSAQTILIVEDEKDIRELLAYSLAREGFTALEADNGVTALHLAGMKKPPGGGRLEWAAWMGAATGRRTPPQSAETLSPRRRW